MGWLDALLGRQVTASIPSGAVQYRFRCTKGFYSEDVRSEYVTGQVYSVRAGNTKLAALVERWVADGKAEVL